MEKFFFSVVRWLMFILAIVAFLLMVGGSIYAVKLYIQSKDTLVQEVQYEQQMPQIDFDNLQKDLEREALQKKQEVVKIRSYVINVINNGSNNHGYSMGNMPGKTISGEDIPTVADYVAKGLVAEQPQAFSACTSCHGFDGKGNYGASPNLADLPIFHNQREVVSNNAPAPKQEIVDTSTQKEEKSDFEKMLDSITSNINIYAGTVGQDGVAREFLQTLIEGEIAPYGQEQQSSYLSQLITMTQKLVEYGKNYEEAKKTSEKTELEAIKWRSVIERFTVQFHQTILEESNKIKQAEQEYARQLAYKESSAIEAQLKLITVLGVVGAALLSFILLTMMLVLIKIEKNTRYLERGNEIVGGHVED
jgi:CHASE3 domain sensor protein/mono/diheme cytochrome c family protein